MFSLLLLFCGCLLTNLEFERKADGADTQIAREALLEGGGGGDKLDRPLVDVKQGKGFEVI